MISLESFQRYFDLGVRSQGGHALVVNVVVIAESIPLFQIRSRSLSVRLRSLHLGIVYRPVSQLSPLHAQLRRIGVRAERRWLKGCIKLL
jgi:hypothetical protein